MSISFGTNGTITYLYDASGRKVKKDVQDNITSVNTVVDYSSGGFQYENAQLQFFPHAEDYVNATKTKGGYIYNYVFNYTDHLGNIRFSYTYDEYIGQLKTLEENHYYPFGLKHTNYNSDYRRIVKTLDESGTRTKIPSGSFPTTEYTDYKYKYNGKEYQDELGLNVTAMDFRMYDNALGRFYNIDKMTDILPSLSPYRFAFNNPVMWSDPTGLLEGGGDDDVVKINLKPIVLTGKSKKSSGEVRPASFNYSLVSLSDWKNPKRPTLEQYNQYHGTNYQSVDDWYYNEKFIPANDAFIKKIHDAQGQAAKVCAVVAGTLVGTAYLLPVIVAASPAIQSSVATLATNPTVISAQSFLYGGMSDYAGANMLANTLGQTVANGGDLSKVNPLGVVASGFNGFAPILAGSAINLSTEARNENKVFNDLNTTANNVMLNYLGNGAKNGLQLPKSQMTNASFATYQGMINSGIDGVGTGASIFINK